MSDLRTMPTPRLQQLERDLDVLLRSLAEANDTAYYRTFEAWQDVCRVLRDRTPRVVSEG